jgi:hypothetical protein
MTVVAQAIQLRFSVWSLILLSVTLLALSLHAIGDAAFKPQVVFQLESKWGTPGSITVYATRNGGGIVSTFSDRVRLYCAREQIAFFDTRPRKNSSTNVGHFARAGSCPPHKGHLSGQPW